MIAGNRYDFANHGPFRLTGHTRRFSMPASVSGVVIKTLIHRLQFMTQATPTATTMQARRPPMKMMSTMSVVFDTASNGDIACRPGGQREKPRHRRGK
jgi:hypothetical protein